MRVLIVEDNRMNRELLVEYMKSYADCETAEDGALGVRAFETALAQGKSFDLVCMDIMMPEQNGQIALQNIRKLEKEAGIKPADSVKVIMTTAVQDQNEVMKAFFQGGAVKYILKPIEEKALFEAIQGIGLKLEKRKTAYPEDTKSQETNYKNTYAG